MQILLSLIFLFAGNPEWNRTALVEERQAIDTVRETGALRFEYPQFVVKDEHDGRLANEINTLVREDVARRKLSDQHGFVDSFSSKYVYNVTYFDPYIFSCNIVLYVNEHAIGSYAINYDIRGDGTLFLSKLVASVNDYDSLFTRWRSKQEEELPNMEDLTDLTWYVTPAGIGLMPKIQFSIRPDLRSTLIGFKENADIFAPRLSVVDRALKE